MAQNVRLSSWLGSAFFLSLASLVVEDFGYHLVSRNDNRCTAGHEDGHAIVAAEVEQPGSLRSAGGARLCRASGCGQHLR